MFIHFSHIFHCFFHFSHFPIFPFWRANPNCPKPRLASSLEEGSPSRSSLSQLVWEGGVLLPKKKRCRRQHVFSRCKNVFRGRRKEDRGWPFGLGSALGLGTGSSFSGWLLALPSWRGEGREGGGGGGGVSPPPWGRVGPSISGLGLRPPSRGKGNASTT